MFQPASVSISGPALSFILYETSKSTVRQNGFLLGEIIHKEITSITDNEQKQIDISKIIKINSVIPCYSNHYFPRGRVDKEKLQSFLGPNFSKVVAWYKYEPTSVVKFTLKDKALHKQFREIFEVPHDLFSICFLAMECTENLASYNYQQNFVRYSNGVFDKLSFYIPNLSEFNNTYQNSEPSSNVFNKILSSIKTDIDNTKGVVAVTEIETAVQNYISKTTTELAESEKKLFDLEEEISLLKEEEYNIIRDSEKASTVNDNSEDLMVFDDLSDVINPESSPELVKKSQRARSKSNSKSSAVTDSNKKETTIQNEVQRSPEAQRKSSPPRARGRGGRKKKS